MGLIRWLADKVQSETGEKERREKVRKIKELAENFKAQVSYALERLNNTIESFNEGIKVLNLFRRKKYKKDIDILNHSLQNYGNCKPTNSFVRESEKMKIEFPTETYKKIEDYIGEIDWTNEEVFWNTFLLSPLGVKFKNREQNISLEIAIHDLQLAIRETLKEIDIQNYQTTFDLEICKTYLENVIFISNIIESKIIPELQLIDAFFEVEKLKNYILVDKDLYNVNFDYNIVTLIGTKYEHYYQFVKNAYAFYIIACKVFDTPVLSRLLAHKTDEQDKEILDSERQLLNIQADKLKSLSNLKR